MSKYFIDHSKLVVHRTAFITDGCNHHKILPKNLEETNNDEQVLNLIDREGYDECPHCFDYFTLIKNSRVYVSH